MKELDKIVKEYLEAKDTDYAIMINGDWGSGKSYYIRHGFQEVVTSEECDVKQDVWAKIHIGTTKSAEWVKTKFSGKNKESEEPKYDENRYYPFYVSLYGVSSVADFNSRVADGVHDWTVKGWQVVTGYADSKFNVNLPISASAYVPHNAVLVFDDLERVCTDRISAVEVLGLINSFAEHQKKKVVIVCNEDEFAKKSSMGGQSEDKIAEYRKYKEKTIRFVYTYAPDVPAVYDIFAQSHKNSYGEYLIREKDYILGLFARGGKKNLRTLKFFVDVYAYIYNAADALLQDKYREVILQRLLITTLIYIMEYKQGASKDDILLLQKQIMTSTEEWLERIKEKRGSTEKTEEKKLTYDITAVQDKYRGYFDEVVQTPWLVDYIMTGAVREEDVKAFVSEQISIENRKEGSPAVKELQKLKDFTHIDDADVPVTAKKIREYIKQDQYTIYELLDAYSTFAKYTIHKIKGVELKKTDDKLWEDALDRIAVQHKYDPLFDLHAVQWDSRTFGIDEVKRYYVIRDYAKEINAKSNSQEYEQEIERFLATIEGGNDTPAIDAYRNTEMSSRLSLHGMDWERLCKGLFTVPNSMACAAIVCVESLLVNDYMGWTALEYEALKAFKEKMGAQVEKDGRMRDIYLREMISVIDEYLIKNYHK